MDIQQLQSELDHARALAFKMMVSSSEIGQMLHFIKKTFTIQSIKVLADSLLEFLSTQDLHSSLLIHNCDCEEFFNHSSDELIDEQLLRKHLSDGRIVTTKTGFIVNYTHCALLVENLPDDETKVGELRDNLAILMDAVEARLWSLLLEKQAQDAQRLKDAFLNLISHELRTPLNPIVGYASRLEKRLTGKVEARDITALNAIKDHADSLRTTVEEILEMYRVELGQLAMHKKPADLRDITLKSLQRSEHLQEQKNIKAAIQLASNICVLVDHQRMIDVIYALLCNAFRFAKTQVTITVSTSGSQSAILQVEDDGPGVPLDQQDFIFKHFLERKTNNSQTEASNGISLYLARAITQQHNGTLKVKGQSSLFTLELPLFQDICN